MTPSSSPRLRVSLRRTTPSRQSGVVLIVALIMLVIIGLASAAVMRSSLSADLVSQNTRRHAQAMQAAEAALGYCETLARNGDAATRALFVQAAATPENWSQFTNWSTPSTPVAATTPPLPTGHGMVNVPSNVLTSSNTRTTTNDSDVHRFAPQCMAQYRNVGAVPNTTVVLVTARGFSSDYQETAGRTQAGSVVWLQSILRLATD